MFVFGAVWLSVALVALLTSRVTDAAVSGCASPNGTKVTFTGSTGVLLTDKDGAGPVYQYGPKETCEWTVVCPSGYLLIHNISGYLVSDSDSGVSLEIGSYKYSDENITKRQYSKLVSGKTIDIRFQTGTKLFDEPNFLRHGVTMHWTCLPQQCSWTPTSGVPLVVTTVDQIYSFASWKGKYGETYADNEACHWQIVCPASSFASLFAVWGYFAWTSDTRLAAVPEYNTSLSVAANIAEQSSYPINRGSFYTAPTFIFKGSSGTLAFRSRSNSGYFMVSVMYSCRANRCTSSNTTGSHYQATAGTIVSGYAGGAIGEECEWAVSCLSNETRLAFAMEDVAVHDYEGRSLEFYSIPDNTTGSTESLLHRIPFANAEELLPRFLTNRSSVRIRYHFPQPSRTIYPSSEGWRLGWKCVPRQQVCLSPNASTVQIVGTATPQTILSDVDPTQTSTYAEQQCRWTVTCPAQQYLHLKLTSIGGNGLGGLSVSDDTNASVWQWLPKSKETESVLLAPIGVDGIVVTLAMNSTGTPLFSALSLLGLNLGSLAVSLQPVVSWRAEFWCSAQQCTEPTHGMTYTAPEGDIQMRTSSSQGTECWWKIQCPSNLPFIGLDFYAWSTPISIAVDGTTSSISALNSSNAMVLEAGSALTFTLIKDLVDPIVSTTRLKKYPNTDAGFSLSYRCLPSQCVSANRSGTVFTGPSGLLSSRSAPEDRLYSHYYYRRVYTGQSCEWTVQCPTGQFFAILPLSTVYLPNYLERYITGSIVDAATNEELVSFQRLMDEGTQYSAVFGVGKVKIQYGALSQGLHVELLYQCLPQRCLGSDATLVGPAGTHGGYLSSSDIRYSPTEGQQCQWKLRCDGTLTVWVSGDELPSNASGFSLVAVGESGEAQSVERNTLVQFERVPSLSWNVFFRSPPSETPSSYKAGQILAYTCQPTKHCYAMVTTGTTLSASAGEVLGDPDGPASTYSTIDKSQACEYTIQCPLQYSYVVIEAAVKAFYDDTLSFSVPTGNSGFNQYRYTFQGQSTTTPFPTGRILPLYRERKDGNDANAPVQVQWETKIDSQAGWGFSYRCMTGRCTSPNASLSREQGGDPLTVIPLSVNETIILSDSDGFSTAVLPIGERLCTYVAACPSSAYRVTVDFKGDLYLHQEVMLTARLEDGTNVTTVRLSGRFHMDWHTLVLPASTVVIEDRPTGTATETALQSWATESGYHLVLSCRLETELRPNNSSAPIAQLTSAKSGVIIGNPEAMELERWHRKYRSGLVGLWNVSCPSPSTQSLYLHMHCALASYSDLPSLLLVPQAETKKSVNLMPPLPNLIPFVCSDSDIRLEVPEGQVLVNWTTRMGNVLADYPEHSLGGESGHSIGFRLAYDCIDKIPPPGRRSAEENDHNQCPPQPYLLSTSGVLSTKAQLEMGKKNCVWQLFCSDPNAKSIFVRVATETNVVRLNGSAYGGQSGRKILEFEDHVAATFAGVRELTLALSPKLAELMFYEVEITVGCLPWEVTTRAVTIEESNLDTSSGSLSLWDHEPLGTSTFHYWSSTDNLPNVDHTLLFSCPVGYDIVFDTAQWTMPSGVGDEYNVSVALLDTNRSSTYIAHQGALSGGSIPTVLGSAAALRLQTGHLRRGDHFRTPLVCETHARSGGVGPLLSAESASGAGWRGCTTSILVTIVLFVMVLMSLAN